MKTLYFECKMGAAGDMLMAALYEICDQKELFLQTMNQAFSEWDSDFCGGIKKVRHFRHTYACYDKRRRGRRACT